MNQSKLWKHLAALTYDIFPILGIFLSTSLLLVLIRQGQEIEPRTLWFQLLLFFEVFFYFAYSWKRGGQTLGMRAWKIGIENYQTMNWPEASVRFFVGILSTVLLGLGLWVKHWRKDKKTWMDLVCHRSVIDVSVKP